MKRIKFHGLRHTCATLLLGAGQPVHVVSARLGHANAAMTLAVYAHCLPTQQASAAAAIGRVLYAGGKYWSTIKQNANGTVSKNRSSRRRGQLPHMRKAE